MMQHDPKLLDAMLNDQFNQEGLYHPGPYWKGYASRIVKAIRSDGLQNFRANSRIGKGYSDSIVMNPYDILLLDSLKSKVYKRIIEFPFFKRYLIDPYLRQIAWHFQQTQKYKNLYYTEILGDWFSQFAEKHSLPDTIVGNPQNIIKINKYKVGWSYLDSFIRIHNYSKVIDFGQIESVFEIGGGFGAFCHTLLHLFPNIKKYLYLDIPPVLYVGTQYIKHFYKNEVIDYRQTRDNNNIRFSSNDSREIITVCPWQIEKINVEVDLFWNCASFQEMTKDIVLNYTQHINRILKDNASQFCFYAYKGGKPEKTLLPKELMKLIENQISMEFEELEPEVEIIDSHYFLGHRR